MCIRDSYITVLADQAEQDAEIAGQEISNGNYRGPLHGVPVAVKDQIHSEGIRTTDASQIRTDFIPNEDATVLANLKAAGAILLGKLNMSEFALGDPISSAFGPAHNPWDLNRSPGTSSTGSGAATAGFLCATSLGEDTGGSIRGPAANCGLVGLRPTWGRVSRYGVDGACWSIDTIGPISRTVADCAITIGAIAGFDPKDPISVYGSVPDYQEGLHEFAFTIFGTTTTYDHYRTMESPTIADQPSPVTWAATPWNAHQIGEGVTNLVGSIGDIGIGKTTEGDFNTITALSAESFSTQSVSYTHLTLPTKA